MGNTTSPRRSAWGHTVAGIGAGAVLVGAAFAATAAMGVEGLGDTGGATRVEGDPAPLIIEQASQSHAKNVILLIGDGMGDSEITSARNYAYGASGELPGIDALPMTGQYTTYSLKRGTEDPDYVPDSAATGTAWATGTKTYDNAVGVDTDSEEVKNLTEIMKDNGLKVGNVTTSEIQDATPAVQLAHVSQRSCYGPESFNADCQASPTAELGSITEQAIETRPDVLMGGGAQYFGQTPTTGDYTDMTLLEQAEERGFQYVTDLDGLEGIDTADQDTPLLGLFAPQNLPTRYASSTPAPASAGTVGDAIECTDNPTRPATQPTLAEMTDKAIELLENKNGFFLQVEGASIDKRDHSADACGQIGETIDLDEAVQVAMDFAAEDGNTLVIVTADHAHTSQIVDNATPGLNTKLLTADGSEMIVAYGTTAGAGSQQHTGSQLRVAAYGPDSARFVGLTDQTDTFFTIVDAMGVDRERTDGTTAVKLKAKEQGNKVAVEVTARHFNGQGEVTLSKGSKVIGAKTLKAGETSISFTSLKKGTHTLTVTFEGTAGYADASTTIKVKR